MCLGLQEDARNVGWQEEDITKIIKISMEDCKGEGSTLLESLAFHGEK